MGLVFGKRNKSFFGLNQTVIVALVCHFKCRKDHNPKFFAHMMTPWEARS